MRLSGERIFYGLLLCLAYCWQGSQMARADEAAEGEFFEKKVRPILVARCYECHSGESKTIQGSLRVDGRALLVKGGDTGPAIVPGNAKESLFIDAINYGDIYQMPPKSRMPDAEVAILTQWVNAGAVWPNDANASASVGSEFDLAARRKAHWSWQAIQEPPLPPVKDEAWLLQDLDRFVLAKIEQQGFSPSASADKRTLVRRIYFDLIGLPPSPAEVEAFVQDESPQAVAKVVDHLLSLPQFGERWGRHWLDLVRYAESRGHEFDYDAANAYQYRDYVIRAINADLPYDRFVVEHLAGDLLSEPRMNPEQDFNESILGTGFWHLGEWVHSPVDLRQDEADRFDNMVDVFSKTFLGLTVACARCHDHKFDAISQRDYYSLFGYLKSSGYRLARFDTMQQHQNLVRDLAEVDGKFLPKLATELAAWAQEPASRIAEKLEAGEESLRGGPWQDLWKRVERTEREKGTKEVAQLAAGLREKAQERQAKSLAAWEKEGGRLIVDYTRASTARMDGPTFGNGPMAAGALQASIEPGKPIALTVAEQGGLVRDPRWLGLKVTAPSQTEPGALGRTERAGRTVRTDTFLLEKPSLFYLVRGTGVAYAVVGSHALIQGPLHGSLYHDLGGGKQKGENYRWVQHNLAPYVGQRLHVELSAKGDEPCEILMVAAGENPPPLPMQNENEALILRWTSHQEPTLSSLSAEIEKMVSEAVALLGQNKLNQENVPTELRQIANYVLREKDYFRPATNAKAQQTVLELLAQYQSASDERTRQIKRESRVAMAMWDGNGIDEQLMIRGNPGVKTLGSGVPRQLLTAIESGMSSPSTPVSSETSGRLELARRMMQPANPYPARVAVNRVWHHLFGRGIVPTPDNLGVLGMEPTHPELLDHLAWQFMQQGWSLKQLIRTVMLSRTYQQASDPAAAEVEERDPDNLLWRRTNIRRLEGEAIRDAMLALSGRLDRTLYGPSVPIHLTDFLQGRGRPASGPLDGAGRRSIYLAIRRNFLSPMMLAFDTPSPFSTVGRRNVSNVPAQALILMNDPFVIEQAGLWARRIVESSADSPEQRINQLYIEAFARPATSTEIADALAFLKTQASALNLSEDKIQTDVRPWSDLCHVLWNVKDFVFLR